MHNAGDVVALMARGASQRATSETKMNDRSSRSHQILTVIVDGFNAVTKAASHGCLHLIDLAGSERVGKSEASGAMSGSSPGAPRRSRQLAGTAGRKGDSHSILILSWTCPAFSAAVRGERHAALQRLHCNVCRHPASACCAAGDRLVEAQHINKSLSALGDVMAALASKNQHVPYRNSKLTQLLQDSLQGNAKVMMFMHISPEANMFSESISTLKFATRVSQITLGQVSMVSGCGGESCCVRVLAALPGPLQQQLNTQTGCHRMLIACQLRHNHMGQDSMQQP